MCKMEGLCNVWPLEALDIVFPEHLAARKLFSSKIEPFSIRKISNCCFAKRRVLSVYDEVKEIVRDGAAKISRET